MSHEGTLPPLALYVHIPWCIRKCPYCDFNSHEAKEELPISAYFEMLKRDLDEQLSFAQGRPITSIFFGGGTPSLMPAGAIASLLRHVAQHFDLSHCREITLEVNPGASEHSNFELLLEGGVNRLSFGAQSFDDAQLAKLGRIHTSDEIYTAIKKAKAVGFENFNIDIMHGLPDQSTEEALHDLERALSLAPNHLSWYQLTIEPNTAFFSNAPALPDDDTQYDIYQAGRAMLSEHGFQQYEVSAYAKANKASIHNINYWEFGDYLAIGAGAHGKVSQSDTRQIVRFSHTRAPKDYLARHSCAPANIKVIKKEDLPLEFMMNALRLLRGVKTPLFNERTWLELETVEGTLTRLREKGWLDKDQRYIRPTSHGHYFLNEVLGEFMAQDDPESA